MLSVRTTPKARQRTSVGISVIVMATVLSGCGTGDAEETTPDQTIEAWRAIACMDPESENFRRTEAIEPSPDVPAAAACELPDPLDGFKRDGIRVFSSEAALNTQIAEFDCEYDTFRIVGPNWYAWTQISENATQLQEQMNGKLACMD